MRSPEILEKAKTAPDTLDAKERLVLGVATIQTAMSDKTAGLEQRTDLLESAIDITEQSLREIRRDPQLSEAERFKLASLALSGIDWKKMEPTEEMGKLLAETMLTLTSGLETAIKQRIDEGRQNIIRGYYEASAILILRDIKEGSLPVDQVRHIQEKELLTSEARRDVALAWARCLAIKADDEQFGDMVKYFADQDDMGAVGELTLVKLAQVSSEISS